MHRFSRRTALALAAGVATHTVLTACGGDDASDGTDASPGTEGPPATTGATTSAGDETTVSSAGTTPASTDSTAGANEAPPLEEYDLDATFRFMYAVGTSRFDPHLATSSFDNTSLYLVYDRLVHQAPDASAVPGLATEWAFAEDGSSLEFTLREGVVFHDGTPFDAEAVKGNIERAKTKEGSAVASELEVVDTVEAVDAQTVRLNLSGPGAQLPLVLADRAGMMIAPASFDDANLDQAPVGTGMFTVTENRPNDQITFQRFEDYWDPDVVRCATFEFSIATDSVTRLNAIRTGQINGTLVDPQQEADAVAAGLVSLRSTGLAYYHLQLNRAFEPFSVLEVRQAMNHAIDRQSIIDSVLFGLGTSSCQSFPEGYFAFDEETGTDTYPFDVDAARALLETAGYGDGFTFEMIVPSGALSEQLAQIIQAQLATVGITASIRQVEGAQTADIFYARQEGDALVAPWGGRSDPTQTLRLQYSDTGFSNPGRHTTPAMMEAIAATEAVQSPEDRATALQAASAQVVADALDVVTYFPDTPYIFSEDVIGNVVWISGKPEFRNVGLRRA